MTAADKAEAAAREAEKQKEEFDTEGA